MYIHIDYYYDYNLIIAIDDCVGEKPAAMQHSGSAALHWYSVTLIFIVECAFLLSGGSL